MAHNDSRTLDDLKHLVLGVGAMAQSAHDCENLSSTPKIRVKKLKILSQENNVKTHKMAQQVKVLDT